MIELFDEKIEKQSYIDIGIPFDYAESCTFIQCDFSFAQLNGKKWIDCVFEHCNLQLIKLTNTVINNIVFRNSKLTGIHFSDLAQQSFSAQFINCVLSNSSFYQCKMPYTEFHDCILEQVDFTGADLTSAIFKNCQFTNAHFENTQCRKTQFIGGSHLMLNPNANDIKEASFTPELLPGLLQTFKIKIL